MILSHLLFKALGISVTANGQGSDSKTMMVYANLIVQAHSRIRVISGKLRSSIYLSDPVLKALVDLGKRGVVVEVLVGPKFNEKSVNEWTARGAKVIILNQTPDWHFTVVDGKHVRVELPHSEESNECFQYFIRNYRYADRVERYFVELNSRHSGAKTS